MCARWHIIVCVSNRMFTTLPMHESVLYDSKTSYNGHVIVLLEYHIIDLITLMSIKVYYITVMY